MTQTTHDLAALVAAIDAGDDGALPALADLLEEQGERSERHVYYRLRARHAAGSHELAMGRCGWLRALRPGSETARVYGGQPGEPCLTLTDAIGRWTWLASRGGWLSEGGQVVGSAYQQRCLAVAYLALEDASS